MPFASAHRASKEAIALHYRMEWRLCNEALNAIGPFDIMNIIPFMQIQMQTKGQTTSAYIIEVG